MRRASTSAGPQVSARVIPALVIPATQPATSTWRSGRASRRRPERGTTRALKDAEAPGHFTIALGCTSCICHEVLNACRGIVRRGDYRGRCRVRGGMRRGCRATAVFHARDAARNGRCVGSRTCRAIRLYEVRGCLFIRVIRGTLPPAAGCCRRRHDLRSGHRNMPRPGADRYRGPLPALRRCPTGRKPDRVPYLESEPLWLRIGGPTGESASSNPPVRLPTATAVLTTASSASAAPKLIALPVQISLSSWRAGCRRRCPGGRCTCSP